MATPSADPWGAPSASDPFAAPAQAAAAAPPQPATSDPFGDPFGAQQPAPAQPAQPGIDTSYILIFSSISNFKLV